MLWLQIVVVVVLVVVLVVDSGFASSCSTCPAGLTSQFQPVCRSIGMRQIDSWFAAHSHTDQSHWSRLREIHIYASALGIKSNLRQAQTHLSHLCFLLFSLYFLPPLLLLLLFALPSHDFIVSQVFWRNWTLWVCCVPWAQNSNCCCWFVSCGYKTKLWYGMWYEVKCFARIAQANFLLHLDLLLSLLQLCKCGISLVSVFRQRLLISEFVHLRSFDTL